VCHRNKIKIEDFSLCTCRLDVLNDANDGACQTATAKLFQMGIVCGIRELLYKVERHSGTWTVLGLCKLYPVMCCCGISSDLFLK